MCAVYSVLNACKLLFDHSEKLDAQLFKALCEGTPNLFPKIVYDGTEVDGILRLLKAAKTWTKHIHKCELICSQPMRRKTITTVEDYFACVRSTLDGGDGERKAAIIGLGKPWDHWTVVRRVDRRRAVFFDRRRAALLARSSMSTSRGHITSAAGLPTRLTCNP
jgi:hypothetical protein